MKIVLVALVVALGVWMLLTRSRPSRPPRRESEPRPGQTSEESVSAQEVAACAHCGLHVPKGEAFWQGPRAYCSEDHRRRGSEN